MNVNKNISVVAGVLFIVAAIAAVIGVLLYDPILNDPDYIVKGSANESQVLLGVFFEIILAFAVIGTSITLFPILKKYNESIALRHGMFQIIRIHSHRYRNNQPFINCNDESRICKSISSKCTFLFNRWQTITNTA
jgi:hypothetical protein